MFNRATLDYKNIILSLKYAHIIRKQILYEITTPVWQPRHKIN